MFKLSTVPNKDEYKANNGKKALLGDMEVTVFLDIKDTKSGSWERGFKFGTITYGVLRRDHAYSKTKAVTRIRQEYSYDHGKTWHPLTIDAKKVKGKVIVERSSSKEFAFDIIQRINREYNPGYRWRP